MYTEKNDNDLAYFLHFQLDIIAKAIEELKKYLSTKANEFQKISTTLDKTPFGSRLNFTQKDLIKKAVKEPGRVFRVKAVSNSYSISENTARTYLAQLVEMKLFLPVKDGRTLLYIAPSDLTSRLQVGKAK